MGGRVLRAMVVATLFVGTAAPAAAECYRKVVEFSEGICAEFVGLSGTAASQEYSGSIDARLPGLLRQLADVGGSVDARISDSEYENILRADVPTALEQGRQCRLEVAKLFFDRICGPAEQGSLAPPAADPAFALRAVISDPDGYTNVRSGAGTRFQIIDKVHEAEIIRTSVQPGPWWQVRTPRNVVGFMHRSRIRLVD